MVKGFYKDLLLGIIIVLLLLGVCVSIDYADDGISNLNESSLSEDAPKGAILVNNSTPVAVNDKAKVIVVKSSDVVHYVHPIIGMYAKPSCGCRYSYRWHYSQKRRPNGLIRRIVRKFFHHLRLAIHTD